MSGSVSGLNSRERANARRLLLQAAELGLHRAPSLHYTQGPKRWEGIDKDLRAWRGQCPEWADCSSFATWCLYEGLRHYGVRDVVNGAAWRAGWTGTMATRGKRVIHDESIKVGDLALYGDPVGRTGHVAVVADVKPRLMVISFGSDPGPFLLPLRYRSDLRQVRRYI